MEMYDEYCTSAVPIETPQQKHQTKQQLPPSTSQAQQTPSQETILKDVLNRRDQTNKDLGAEETSLKEGIDRKPSTLTSNDTQGTTEGMESRRTLSQGRISTLSSVVRPMPMTATRTISITREES